MSEIYLLLGVLLLVVVIVDLLWTTLWVEGSAGPVTARVMAWTWTALRTVAGGRPRVLSLAGPLILTLGLTVWITLLWTGWTFLFAGAENTLIDTRDTGPISWAERFYFVGYSIFTMGNGDFTPRDGVWQIVTSLTTASGMLFVTLSITYVLSVLGAVTQKRSFASGVSGLGSSGAEILQKSWAGDEFRGLEVPLNTVATQLNTLTSNHKAYPILHYFYSPETKHAPASSVTVLDEALTLARFGVAEENRPNAVLIGEARSSVQNYLETVGSAYIEPAAQSPPDPDIAALREAGIPTVSDREFRSAVADLDERRRTLLGLIESGERRWPTSRDTSRNAG